MRNENCSSLNGPSNFHLVLIDNGRSSALAEKSGRDVLRCIRCSACLNVCPVYERTGGHSYGNPYPGRSAPNACFGFLLAGGAFVAIQRNKANLARRHFISKSLR